MNHQDLNRLQALVTLQEGGGDLSPEQEVELSVLWRAWDALHDALNHPPWGQACSSGAAGRGSKLSL